MYLKTTSNLAHDVLDRRRGLETEMPVLRYDRRGCRKRLAEVAARLLTPVVKPLIAGADDRRAWVGADSADPATAAAARAAVHGGNGRFTGMTSMTLSQTVNAAGTTTALAASSSPVKGLRKTPYFIQWGSERPLVRSDGTPS
jgi:hypothetical protein